MVDVSPCCVHQTQDVSARAKPESVHTNQPTASLQYLASNNPATTTNNNEQPPKTSQADGPFTPSKHKLDGG